MSEEIKQNETQYTVQVTENQFMGIFSMCNLMVMNAMDYDGMEESERKEFELSFYRFRDIISNMTPEDIRGILIRLDDIRKEIIEQKDKQSE